jgi:hypothetical protein
MNGEDALDKRPHMPPPYLSQAPEPNGKPSSSYSQLKRWRTLLTDAELPNVPIVPHFMEKSKATTAKICYYSPVV